MLSRPVTNRVAKRGMRMDEAWQDFVAYLRRLREEEAALLNAPR